MQNENEKEGAAATEAQGGETAPAKGDLGDVLKVVERFFPEEAAPLFDLFEGPFTTAKLWAACGAIGALGPKIDRVLAGSFPSEVPEGTAPHFKAAMPAASLSPDEKIANAKAALASAEMVPGTDDPRPAATMNPLLAAALAAVIKDVAAEVIRRITG